MDDLLVELEISPDLVYSQDPCVRVCVYAGVGVIILNKVGAGER